VQQIDESVFVAQGVQIYGRVSIGEGSSLWPYSVIRAEANSVEIGRFSNVQDFVMLHVGYEHGVVIGDYVSVTHHATIHGATIGDACLIGIGATVMDGAVVGPGSIVAGGAVVREGSVFEPGSIIAGTPGKAIRQRDSARENRLNAWHYHRNAQAFRRGEHRSWDGPEYQAWLLEIRSRVGSDRDLDDPRSD
jgi:carbonic anhydrase/acetyltransferase-like protein (isoleucine patch superfamily)